MALCIYVSFVTIIISPVYGLLRHQAQLKMDTPAFSARPTFLFHFSGYSYMILLVFIFRSMPVVDVIISVILRTPSLSCLLSVGCLSGRYLSTYFCSNYISSCRFPANLSSFIASSLDHSQTHTEAPCACAHYLQVNVGRTFAIGRAPLAGQAKREQPG